MHPGQHLQNLTLSATIMAFMAKSAASSASSGKFDPSMRIVVLYGQERFLIEEYTRRFAEMLDEKFGGIEQFHFDGDTADPAAVLDELRSYGLIQRHKLVILDNTDVFLAGGKNAAEEDDEEDADEEEASKSSRRPLMERYAQNPVADATLLMRAKLWRKGKIDKLIEKVGCIKSCELVNEASAVGWCIGRCAKRYDAVMERPAADLLVARIGPTLLHLDTELMKLIAMAGAGKPITRELVVEAVGLSREEKAWEIQAAVLSGNAGAMLRKLRELLDISRQDEVPITWSIVDILRKLHTASQLLRRRMPPEAVSRAAKLWGDSGMAVRLAGQHHPRIFAQLLRSAIEVDQFAKSGVGDPQRNLERLLVKIADKVSPRSKAAAETGCL